MNNLKKDILRTIVTAKQGGYKQDYLNALNEISNIIHKDEYKMLKSPLERGFRGVSERRTLGKLPKKREMKTQ